MRTPVQITPTVHTEGGEFRLNIVDDAAAPDNKHWRITVKDGALQVVLLNDTNNECRVLEVRRSDMTYDIVRGGDVQL